jgi:hypothetical protein
MYIRKYFVIPCLHCCRLMSWMVDVNAPRNAYSAMSEFRGTGQLWAFCVCQQLHIADDILCCLYLGPYYIYAISLAWNCCTYDYTKVHSWYISSSFVNDPQWNWKIYCICLFYSIICLDSWKEIIDMSLMYLWWPMFSLLSFAFVVCYMLYFCLYIIDH